MWRVCYAGKQSLPQSGFPQEDPLPYFDGFFCTMFQLVSQCLLSNLYLQFKKKILNSFCASLLSVFKISLPFQSSGSCALSLILAWQMSSRGFLLERQPARYLKRPDCFQKKSTDSRGWQRLVKQCGAHCTHRHGSFGDDRLNHASFHSGGFIQCSEVQRTEFLNLPDTYQSANH